MFDKLRAWWRWTGEEVERENRAALALGVVRAVNDQQHRCHICGFPWVGNGPGLGHIMESGQPTQGGQAQASARWCASKRPVPHVCRGYMHNHRERC